MVYCPPYELFTGKSVAIKKPRILFVDDEINILRAFERSLHELRHKWDLTFVSSGEAAIREAKNRHFNVVVTDLSMPGMSGLDVVQVLNDTARQTKCIIVTGTADLQTAAEIINTVDVFRFYTKPCATEVLTEGISAALTGVGASPGPGAAPHVDPGNIVLDRLSTGVLLVSPKGSVIYMNQAAAEMVAALDGLSIGHDQVLRASSSTETGHLLDIFNRVAKMPDKNDVIALSIERPSLREALKLLIAPLENPAVDPNGFVVVFITDPVKNTLPTAEMVSRLFNLTPVEGRLALQLIRGQRTEEIADLMGITVSSVRTYIKRVMEKTGTNRQVDLVRLLLCTPQVISRYDKGERQH